MSEAILKDAIREKYAKAALQVATAGGGCFGSSAIGGCDPITSNRPIAPSR